MKKLEEEKRKIEDELGRLLEKRTEIRLEIDENEQKKQCEQEREEEEKRRAELEKVKDAELRKLEEQQHDELQVLQRQLHALQEESQRQQSQGLAAKPVSEYSQLVHQLNYVNCTFGSHNGGNTNKFFIPRNSDPEHHFRVRPHSCFLAVHANATGKRGTFLPIEFLAQ